MPYQSVWNHRSADIERVLEEVKNDHPQDWQAAHNTQRGDKQQREAYCQRVCAKLRAIGIPAGMNGKRGNPQDLSEDIIALPNVDAHGRGQGGATDTSGRYAAIEIRDIIASAGPDNEGNQAGRPYFGDVTVQTIEKGATGCYVEPLALGGERPPVGGNPTNPPVKDPAPPPPPQVSNAALEARIATLEMQNANILTGIGALATQLGNLSGNILDPDGGFDTLTKRIFGVGTDDQSVAEEVVAALSNPDLGLGCKVHRRLRG